MRINIARLTKSGVLSGAPSGRHLFGQLVSILPPEPEHPEPLYLDFEGVEVVTASFLREAVFGFRDFVRGRKSNFYPVVANVNSDITDEIYEFVQVRGDAIMSCKFDDEGSIVRTQLIGKLEPMQKLTFDLVNKYRETTATKLMEQHEGEIKTTAWNNRLASLSNLGLIFEEAKGRTKTYRTLFLGGDDGRRL